MQFEYKYQVHIYHDKLWMAEIIYKFKMII